MLATSTASLAGFDFGDLGGPSRDAFQPGAIINAFDGALQQKYAGKAARAIAAVNAKKKPRAAAPTARPSAAPSVRSTPSKQAWYRTPWAIGGGALALLIVVVLLVRGGKH